MVVCRWGLFWCAGAMGETIESGNCGDGVVYNLSDTGVLTILNDGSGTGNLAGMIDDSPWMTEHAEDVTSVVIEEAVNSIGMELLPACPI